jgi:hypothetical protein
MVNQIVPRINHGGLFLFPARRTIEINPIKGGWLNATIIKNKGYSNG